LRQAAQTLLAYGQARGRIWLLDVVRQLADQKLLQILLLAGT
jgi:hypothetical protein